MVFSRPKYLVITWLISSALLPGQLSLNQMTAMTFSTPQLKPQDPSYPLQQGALATIDLEKAWDITTGSKNIVVAVVDDAIDIHHPDLSNNMGAGWDFVDGDNDPSPGSCIVNNEVVPETHGTLVTGVIAAVANNNIGVSGVNWNVTIMPLRVGCDYNSGRTTQAIEYAISHGADIINLSYGGPITSIAAQSNYDNLKQILNSAKNQVLVVAAAGNNHVSNDDIKMYPANIDLDNFISVAASDNSKQLTEWTQYGATTVDVAAPGVEMETTRTRVSFNDPEYDKVSGTSFSTPVVSGVAALLKAKNLQQGMSEIEPADIKAILQASISKLNGQSGLLKTDGLVNAANALGILNSPRPVITIETVNYDDSTSVTAATSYKNGLIDPWESGVLRLRLKNLWDNAPGTIVTLSVSDNSISIPVAMQNIDYWPKGEVKELSFNTESGFFAGNKRFLFQLTVEATGEHNPASFTRQFIINTGILEHLKLQSGIIQKDRTDDYQYFHLNMPQGTQQAAVEVTYNKNDSRDIGLIASINEKPAIHFNRLNGSSYWFDAGARSDDDTGFERIDIAVPTNNASSLNVLVFNKPATSPTQSFASNKPYSVRGCYFSDDDGNSAPRVNAGTDQIVLAGAAVTLDGSVSDIDGEISRMWWNSIDDIKFSSTNGTQATFIAPASGIFSFTLTAIDNGCKLSRDTVKIEIKNESGEVPGFQLNPAKIIIEENSSIDLIVTAVDGAKIIDNLEIDSAPTGLQFIKGNGELSGNRIIWQNAGPVDTYKVRFTANTGNGNKNSFIIIDVVPRGGKGTGGGCVSVGSGKFDPLFWIYIILCFYFLKKTRPIQQNCDLRHAKSPSLV